MLGGITPDDLRAAVRASARPNVHARGVAHAAGAAVISLRTVAADAVATVDGGTPWTVTLGHDVDGLWATRTCPYNEGPWWCKHAVAVGILVADGRAVPRPVRDLAARLEALGQSGCHGSRSTLPPATSGSRRDSSPRRRPALGAVDEVIGAFTAAATPARYVRWDEAYDDVDNLATFIPRAIDRLQDDPAGIVSLCVHAIEGSS